MTRYLMVPILLILISPFTAHACDPIALDWDTLYLNYDKNKDRNIDLTEWKSLIELKNQPYQWSEKISKNDPYRLTIFHQLDQNNNHKISEEEMFAIYQFFPNPCDGWGETLSSESKDSTQLWDNLKQLFYKFLE